MGLLAFFVYLALPLWPAEKPWLSLLIAGLAILVVVTIEEASQGLFKTRTMSWADLVSSYAGVVCFGYAAWLLRLRRKCRDYRRAGLPSIPGL